MVKCLNCVKEVVGKGKYCSASCKTIYNRNNRNVTVTPETATVTDKSVTNALVTVDVTPVTAPVTLTVTSDIAMATSDKDMLLYLSKYPRSFGLEQVNRRQDEQVKIWLSGKALDGLRDYGVSIPVWRMKQVVC